MQATFRGAQLPGGRVLHSALRGAGFKSQKHRVVPHSKIHFFFFLFHINLVNTQNMGERFDTSEKLWTG